MNKKLISIFIAVVVVGGFFVLRSASKDGGIIGADDMAKIDETKLVVLADSKGVDTNFASDGKYLYYSTPDSYVKLVGPDPDTFEELHSGFFRDKDRMYNVDYNGNMTSSDELDIETSERLDICESVEISMVRYWKDKKNVYVLTIEPYESLLEDGNYFAKRLEEVDVNTFEIIGVAHTPDGTMPISRAYAKDAKRVYQGCGQIVEGVNPDTFVMPSSL